MALSRSPRLLIADEPTTALDLVLQAQILELLKKLQKDHEMAVWLITHDFAAVAEMADRVLIMKDGLALESGGSEILRSPRADYTAKLLDSIPILNLSPRERSVPKPGRPLLQVEDLVLSYDPLPFWPRESRRRTPCVENVSLSIRSGETVAIVGESGSGKSSLARGILNLIRPLSGRILFEGLEVTDCPPRVRYQLGAIMQIIFQDPFASMDPRMYVEDIILEGLRSQADLSPQQEKEMVGDLLTAVGLERSMSDRYPHEFSGGQRQRISIARALATGPKLLICDEPTSALDVTVQAQILKLLEQIQKDRQMAFLFISHDLALVSQVADHVLVMKSGRVVEQGPTSEVLSRPKSVYTQTLLEAMPNLRKGGAH
jgi:ABC-type glutathione transport system ATPase component